jgi:hypothetical protein
MSPEDFALRISAKKNSLVLYSLAFDGRNSLPLDILTYATPDKNPSLGTRQQLLHLRLVEGAYLGTSKTFLVDFDDPTLDVVDRATRDAQPWQGKGLQEGCAGTAQHPEVETILWAIPEQGADYAVVLAVSCQTPKGTLLSGAVGHGSRTVAAIFDKWPAAGGEVPGGLFAGVPDLH